MRAWARFVGAAALVLSLSVTTASAAPYLFTELANSTTAMPGGGTFASFRFAAGGGSSADFVFMGSGGTGGAQQGLYHNWYAPPPGAADRIVDKTTAAPDGSGAFTGFEHFSWGRFLGAWNATTVTQTGIYGGHWNTRITLANRSTVMPSGAETFATFGPVSVSMLTFSSSTYAAAFTGAGATDRGVFLYHGFPSGTLARVAGPATPVPGGAPGETFVSFGDVARNHNIDVTFTATTSTGRKGLYLYDAGSATVSARADTLTTPVPGGGAGEVFTDFYVGDFRGYSGGFTFYADTSAGTSGPGAYDALYRGSSPGGFYKVAGAGTPLPTAAGIAMAASFDDSLVYQDSTLFRAELAGGGSGIYLAFSPGAGGGIEKIVAAGDTLGAGSVDDVRLGKLDPNNGNKLFLTVAFADGKQALYSTLVPEPGAAATLAAIAMTALASKRRRRGNRPCR